ncbi:MAG: hypothetical protein J4O07_00010 [Chloroflexi bacterium]|nr:hypothetical protein [Chloroflexota bacterium]
MAILDNAVRTSSSSARAALAGSVCHPDLDINCHAWPELVEWVVVLLAMTFSPQRAAISSLHLHPHLIPTSPITSARTPYDPAHSL